MVKYYSSVVTLIMQDSFSVKKALLRLSTEYCPNSELIVNDFTIFETFNFLDKIQ